MKRFRQRLWGGIATLSLLLCIGTIGLLVRSEFKVRVWEWLRRSSSGATWNLIQIVIGHDKISLDIISGPAKPYRGVQIFQFPLLFAALIFAAMAIIALERYRRMCKRQRIRDGLCIRCDYDLRATPELCPECGTIPEKKEMISN